MFLYLSLFLAPSLLSKQITNICACATAHSRDTDTHRHTQYTGTQGHSIPPFVLRLIVYPAQIILRTGCICLFIRLFSFVFAPHEQICSAHAAENSRNRFFLYVSFIGRSSRVFMPFSRAKKTRRLLRFANYFRLARSP